MLYATPGLTVQPGVNNNALMPGMSLFSAHGGVSTEGRVFVDGVSVNGPFGQNSVTQFAFDVANAQEMQVLVGGGLGESETGGPIANIIPKSGGNRFSGSAFVSGTQSRLQSDNITDTLRGQGIPTAADGAEELGHAAVHSAARLLRDRLWFFANVRTVGIAQVVAGGLAPNRYLGDPTKWLYAPEPGIETRFAESKMDVSARLTGQVTPTQPRVVLVSAAASLPRLDADGRCGWLPGPRRRLDRRAVRRRRPSLQRLGPATRMAPSA